MNSAFDPQVYVPLGAATALLVLVFRTLWRQDRAWHGLVATERESVAQARADATYARKDAQIAREDAARAWQEVRRCEAHSRELERRITQLERFHNNSQDDGK